MSRAAGRISPGSGDDDAVDGSLACGFVECFADLGCSVCASDDANFARARIKLREGSPWYALAREQLPLDETKSARWRFAGLLAGCETAELTAPQSDGSTLLAYAVDVGDAAAVECLLDRLPRRDREETALRANHAGASAASFCDHLFVIFFVCALSFSSARSSRGASAGRDPPPAGPGFFFCACAE